MKKIIFLLSLATTSFSYGRNDGNTLRAFNGKDWRVGTNDTKADAVAFVKYGTLPANAAQVSYRHDHKGNPVTPMSLATIVKATRLGRVNGLRALTARFNQLNIQYNGYYTGGTVKIITENDALILLESELVFEAPLDQNTKYDQNGNLISLKTGESVGTDIISRYPYMLKDGIERALWIKTPDGAQPIMSLYCFNIISTMVAAQSPRQGSHNRTPPSVGYVTVPEDDEEAEEYVVEGESVCREEVFVDLYGQSLFSGSSSSSTTLILNTASPTNSGSNGIIFVSGNNSNNRGRRGNTPSTTNVGFNTGATKPSTTNVGFNASTTKPSTTNTSFNNGTVNTNNTNVQNDGFNTKP